MMTTGTARRRRRRRTTTTLVASTLLLLGSPCTTRHCHAGWIDEDTPSESRTTSPLKVVPNLPPPKKNGKMEHEDADDDDSKKKRQHGRRRHRDPTATPTYYPTFDPTSVPSEPPSSLTEPPTPSPRIYDLVFSDEFNTPHRTFHDGKDPRWTALEKNDYTNDAQHYYAADNAYTDRQGNLVIKSEAADTTIIGFNDVTLEKEQDTKHFKSAMLQSWNKFCFTGGVMEAEIALPGKSNVGGLWPAFWLLGNLARHTYVGSSEHVWPWSTSVCTEKSRSAQLVSACDRVEHYGLASGVGRGAPEIDVFEVQSGTQKANTGTFLKMPVGQPFMSSSYQVAPGRLPRPGDGWWPAPGQWYNNLTGGMNTSLNILFYGTYNHFLDDTRPAEQDYFSDAISYNRQLNSSHFGKFHKYRLEWEPPDKNGTAENNYTETFGYLRWFLDDEFVMEVKGEGLNETGAEVSTEPMYILLNTAISSQWGFPERCPSNCPCKTYNCHGSFAETCGFSGGFCDMLARPAQYKVNWVRVYQDKNDPKQKVGCSTPERPTRKFIEAHAKKYKQTSDKQPIKPIQNGGGICSPTSPTTSILPQSCGGSKHGTCRTRSTQWYCAASPLKRGACAPTSRCACHGNWTGPHCLNPTASDDVVWDPPETLADLGYAGPYTLMGSGPFVLLVGLVGIALVAPVVMRIQKRMAGGYRRVAVGGS